jgi:hypothetical protein
MVVPTATFDTGLSAHQSIPRLIPVLRAATSRHLDQPAATPAAAIPLLLLIHLLVPLLSLVHLLVPLTLVVTDGLQQVCTSTRAPPRATTPP